MNPIKRKTGEIILLCIICFVTFFVNNNIIKPDIMESRNIITAREMVQDGNWIVPTMNGEFRFEKPPLPTWITAVAEIIAPDSIAFARGMAALVAVLLIIYFYLFAARILKIDPLIPTILLCTCYNVILMGRTASWDIYCHAFMMGGLYYLALALSGESRTMRNFLLSGLFMGLSIMSKGPVSPYALLLPFLIAFVIIYRPSTKGKGSGIFAMILVALVVGVTWYIYIRFAESDAFTAVVQKESGSWMNHNVRPWWYYWKFFLESGIWSLLLLTSIFLPLFNRKRPISREHLLSLIWTAAALILLSFMPEKKSRYLFPLLIPACYLMGCMITWWRESSFAVKSDKLLYRLNTILIACVVLALPVAMWLYLVKNEYIAIMGWSLASILCLAIAAYIIYSAIKLRPMGLLYGVLILFLISEAFIFPRLSNIINNPEMNSIAATRDIAELENIDFYYNGKEPLRIELVYAAHRKIRPLEYDNLDSLLEKLPCAILTHGEVEEELTKEIWNYADSLHIGLYDDNRHPEGNRLHSNNFVYNVTLLTKREEPPTYE